MDPQKTQIAERVLRKKKSWRHYVLWLKIILKAIVIKAIDFIDYAKAIDCVDYNKLWKILKEMGIPDHMTCLLRNLYTDQEETVRNVHGTVDWFQIGKAVPQDCILSPCLFNFYAEYIM